MRGRDITACVKAAQDLQYVTLEALVIERVRKPSDQGASDLTVHLRKGVRMGRNELLESSNCLPELAS